MLLFLGLKRREVIRLLSRGQGVESRHLVNKIMHKPRRQLADWRLESIFHVDWRLDAPVAPYLAVRINLVDVILRDDADVFEIARWKKINLVEVRLGWRNLS